VIKQQLKNIISSTAVLYLFVSFLHSAVSCGNIFLAAISYQLTAVTCVYSHLSNVG